jgi:hypothetical protein
VGEKEGAVMANSKLTPAVERAAAELTGILCHYFGFKNPDSSCEVRDAIDGLAEAIIGRVEDVMREHKERWHGTAD